MGTRGPKPKPFECPEPVFWYLVGLMAADGCLGQDRRSINITLKEKDFLERIKCAIGSRGGISPKFHGRGNIAHQLQFKSHDLWARLRDVLRGVIDGDGNIRRWRHPTNGREQWCVRICGASRPFLQWIQETAERLWFVTGGLHVRAPVCEKHHPLHTLKFGKIAAKVILTECYYPNALALERKEALAAECIATSVGWSQSKTVRDPGRWQSWKYVHIFLHPPKRASSSNEDVDPTAGLVSEHIPRWWAGVAKLA